MNHDRPWKPRWVDAVSIAIVIIVLALAVAAKLEAHEIPHEHHGSSYTITVPHDPQPPEPGPGPDCPAEASPEWLDWYIAPDSALTEIGDGSCAFPTTLNNVTEAWAGRKSNIAIWMRGGTYSRAQVTIREHSKLWGKNDQGERYQLALRCWPGETCIWDGEHRKGWAFRVSVSGANSLNLTIEDVTMVRYIQWMVAFFDPKFRDQRELRDQNWLGDVILNRIRMEQLGNNWGCENNEDGGDCKGFGGVTTQNARRVHATDIICKNFINKGSGGGIHCVYWSNGSSNNTVTTANCTKCTAACFKTRDESNDNEHTGITCKDTPTCYLSSMPDSRLEEGRDYRTTFEIVAMRNVDDAMLCKLEHGERENARNCRQVVVN